MAHFLAARVEELGTSRRRDERIQEHLTQVCFDASLQVEVTVHCKGEGEALIVE